MCKVTRLEIEQEVLPLIVQQSPWNAIVGPNFLLQFWLMDGVIVATARIISQ